MQVNETQTQRATQPEVIQLLHSLTAQRPYQPLDRCQSVRPSTQINQQIDTNKTAKQVSTQRKQVSIIAGSVSKRRNTQYAISTFASPKRESRRYDLYDEGLWTLMWGTFASSDTQSPPRPPFFCHRVRLRSLAPSDTPKWPPSGSSLICHISSYHQGTCAHHAKSKCNPNALDDVMSAGPRAKAATCTLESWPLMWRRCWWGNG